MNERRLVTILFSDLSGFTSMSERMDPEDVQHMLDQLFARFRSVIESRGGTVDKFIGDAVMAVFGAPAAHGDDPLRAVRAGLEMQREIGRFNKERATSLLLRIGINTGVVLWGSVAGDRPTAIGDPVNVAQRLEACARTGHVLVSETVQRATLRQICYRPGAPVRVKGREEPVTAFEAEEEVAGAPTGREGGTQATIVGREAETARLSEGLESRRGVFLVIEGEAGVGKSRLLEEFRFIARKAMAWTAVGVTVEGSAMLMSALGEIVRSEAGMAGQGSADSGRLAEFLARDLESAPGSVTDRENWAQRITLSIGGSLPGARVAGIDPERMRPEMHHAWEMWLRARLARGPVVLCIDDLHDADESTLALLAYLAARLRDLPLLLLATSRPGAAIPIGFESLRLAGLLPPAVASLAEILLGSALHPDLAHFLAQQSGGNPLYVEELCRFLRDENLIAESPMRLRIHPDRLPEGLHGLLVSHVDALDPQTKETAKTAAVVGPVFWRSLLARLLQRDVEPDLETARCLHIVVPHDDSLLPGDAELSFRQALFRDAAYSLLPKRDRLRLHALVASQLKPFFTSGGRRVRAVAAGHLEAAGQGVEAGRLYFEAAEEALRTHALLEARAWARQAVRLSPGAAAHLAAAKAARSMAFYEEAREQAALVIAAGDATEEQRLAAGLLQVECLGRQGHLKRAREALDAVAVPAAGSHLLVPFLLTSGRIRTVSGDQAGALDAARQVESLTRPMLAEKPGDSALSAVLADALIVASSALDEAGKPGEALASLLEAKSLSESSGERLQGARILNNLGVFHFKSGRREPALEEYRAALETYRELGDRYGVALCLGNMGAALRGLERLAEAQVSFEAALAIRRDIGDAGGTAQTLLSLGGLDAMQGNPVRSRERLAEALAIARGAGLRKLEASTICEIANNEADPDRALALLEESLRISQDIGYLLVAADCLLSIGRIQFSRGLLVEALGKFSEAAAAYEAVRDARGVASAWCLLARVHGRLGELGEATALAQRSRDLSREIGSSRHEAEALSCLAELAAGGAGRGLQAPGGSI